MEGDFRLGLWIVQPSLNNISRNGSSVRLEPKAMEVLVCLAQHGDSVVSKERLIGEVWPHTFVGDDALTRCIGELRRAFDDDPKTPKVIETIPKRGYRLVAEIKPIIVSHHKWLRFVIWGAAAVTAAIVVAVALWPRPPVVKSIAVLPF